MKLNLTEKQRFDWYVKYQIKHPPEEIFNAYINDEYCSDIVEYFFNLEFLMEYISFINIEHLLKTIKHFQIVGRGAVTNEEVIFNVKFNNVIIYILKILQEQNDSITTFDLCSKIELDLPVIETHFEYLYNVLSHSKVATTIETISNNNLNSKFKHDLLRCTVFDNLIGLGTPILSNYYRILSDNIVKINQYIISYDYKEDING
jgi:hypothetical protein